MDQNRLNWRSFADHVGGTDEGSISSTWNLTATPTLYVIDSKGVIRYKWLGSPGAKIIDDAIEKLIKEAESK